MPVIEMSREVRKPERYSGKIQLKFKFNTLCCLINISFTNNKIFNDIITTTKTLSLFESFLNKYSERNDENDIIYQIIWLLSNIVRLDSKNLNHILNSNLIEKITTILLTNTRLNSRLSEIGVYFLYNVIIQSKENNISINIVHVSFI